MKRFFLPVMTVAVASASFIFTGCSSTDNKDEIFAEIRDILDEGEAYKTHEKQKDKFVLPNASLETSRALYLPIGGAFTDMVKETVGDDYLMSVKWKATKSDNEEIWDSLKTNYNEQWDSVAQPGKDPRRVTLKEKNNHIDAVKNGRKKSFKDIERAEYYKAENALAQSLHEEVEGYKDGVFNGDIGLKGARASMKKLISGSESMSDEELENAVVVEIIKKVRLSDASQFSRRSEEEVSSFLKNENEKYKDADKKKTEAEEASTVVTWLGLNSANKSSVYNSYLKVKAAAEKKMNDEKAAAWDEVIEADRKVAAFTTYWVARVGRILYPVVIPLVPIPEPVGGLLTASTPIATEALDGVTSELEKTDDWLPKSLTPEIGNAPAMKAQFGDNPSMDDILAKLGSDDLVKSMLDQKKIDMLKKAAEVGSNPLAVLSAGPEIKDAIEMSTELTKTLKADLDANDYGMVPLHMLGTLGSDLGVEFLRVLNEQLDPYRYANDIALKRIEYTNKAMSWIADDQLTKSMDDIAGDN